MQILECKGYHLSLIHRDNRRVVRRSNLYGRLANVILSHDSKKIQISLNEYSKYCHHHDFEIASDLCFFPTHAQYAQCL